MKIVSRTSGKVLCAGDGEGGRAIVQSDDRSTDQGRTFQRTDLPFKLGANEDGRSMGERLAIDPADNLGTRKNGLWRSTDHGVTWSQVATFPVKDGGSSGIGLSFVTFGPAGSRTVYAGVADKTTSLYRSTDSGATWAAVPGQPAGQLPHHGVLSGDGSFYVTYTDVPGPNGVKAGSVWKHTPSTGSWKDISPMPGTGFGFAGLAVDPQRPSTVMVTTLGRWWPSDELFGGRESGSLVRGEQAPQTAGKHGRDVQLRVQRGVDQDAVDQRHGQHPEFTGVLVPGTGEVPQCLADLEADVAQRGSSARSELR
ncbi:hypothetical protein AB0A63_10620 [Lentzea sp. NPDC042327]|uniref:hypothetical protein n=1 Tax=Lentzea sp. NPDC042327 TaxID=3154801 RepID=UPI0033F367D6